MHGVCVSAVCVSAVCVSAVCVSAVCVSAAPSAYECCVWVCIWQILFKMLHPQNPPDQKTRCTFKLHRIFNLNLYREIQRNLSPICTGNTTHILSHKKSIIFLFVWSRSPFEGKKLMMRIAYIFLVFECYLWFDAFVPLRWQTRGKRRFMQRASGLSTTLFFSTANWKSWRWLIWRASAGSATLHPSELWHIYGWVMSHTHWWVMDMADMACERWLCHSQPSRNNSFMCSSKKACIQSKEPYESLEKSWSCLIFWISWRGLIRRASAGSASLPPR